MQREVGIDERIVSPAVNALPLDGLDPDRNLTPRDRRPEPAQPRQTNRAARRAHLQPGGRRRGSRRR
jgi:hypothetical protein